MLRNDTNDFEENIMKYCNNICSKFKVQMPEILNCSPDSFYTCFKKIGYSDL